MSLWHTLTNTKLGTVEALCPHRGWAKCEELLRRGGGTSSLFFFFLRDKFRGHSLAKKWYLSKKLSEKVYELQIHFFWHALFFSKGSHVWLVFFSPSFYGFFFLLISLPLLTQLTQLKSSFFFLPRKKKTRFLLTHSNSVQKSHKINHTSEKKGGGWATRTYHKKVNKLWNETEKLCRAASV